MRMNEIERAGTARRTAKPFQPLASGPVAHAAGLGVVAGAVRRRTDARPRRRSCRPIVSPILTRLLPSSSAVTSSPSASRA